LGLFDFLKRKKSKGVVGPLPADQTFFKTLRVVLGSSKHVQQPYKNSIWVYASVRKIAQNISRVPMLTYPTDVSLSGEDMPKPDYNNSLYDLLKKPNPYMTDTSLIESTMTYLEIFGEAFWVFDGRDKITDLPTEIWVLNPMRFEAIITDEGVMEGWKYKLASSKEVTFDVDDVLHFKYFNPYDDLRGLSPLDAASLSIEQDYFTGEHNKNFFINGASVGGVIEFDEELTDEAYNRMLRAFEDRHQGYTKAHKIAIIEGGGKYKPFTLSHKDLEFVNMKEITRDEIFAAFGTNTVVLGIYNQMRSYEGVRAAHRAFWVETLVPKIILLEDVINAHFVSKLTGKGVGNLQVKFDLNTVEALREDYYRKVDAAERLYQMGFPINMINKRLNLGMSEVEWGDKWWIDQNKVPAGSAPQPSDSGGKTVKPAHTSYSRFSASVNSASQMFASKLKKFVFEQRKEVLKNVTQMLSDYKKASEGDVGVQVFPDDEDKRLQRMLKHAYTMSIKSGVESIAIELGVIDFVFNPKEFDYLINSRLSVIPFELVASLKRSVVQLVTESLDEGLSIEDIIAKIRKVYNIAAAKMNTIARTEAVGAINQGRVAAMKRFGIKQHTWLHCGDEQHKSLQNCTVDIDGYFKANLKYPCDLGSTAESSIGCSCMTIPVTVKEGTDV